MDMEKANEMILAWELYEQGLGNEAIARRQGRHRETVIALMSGIEAEGLKPVLTAARRASK